MHEFNLLKDLLRKIDKISADNNGVKIERVQIWLGALSHITPEHFKEHFDEESKGHSCEGASLDIEQSDDEKHENAMDILLKSVDVAA